VLALCVAVAAPRCDGPRDQQQQLFAGTRETRDAGGQVKPEVQEQAAAEELASEAADSKVLELDQKDHSGMLGTSAMLVAVHPNAVMNEEIDGSLKCTKLNHLAAQHDTRHAHSTQSLPNVIAAIVRMRRWMKCQDKASVARAANATPAQESSGAGTATDMCIDALTTVTEEDELIPEAPC
jgi:hypothetical protein